MMKRALFSAAVVWVFGFGFGSGTTALADPVATGDSDRVVFYGDKVCDPPTYGYMVESFVRAKYPASKVRYWHFGTHGHDKIEVANEQFDRLVAPIKPTHIVLGWGLGDGGLKALNVSRIEKVKSEFETLVKRCKALGAEVYILTPPKPTVAKKNILSITKYDETVHRVGEVMAEVGAAHGATVLDWFGGCVEMEKSVSPRDMTGKDGIFPSPLSQSVAANLLMRAWNFEPIRVLIDADFEGETASVSEGSVKVSMQGDKTMRLDFSDFPMHLHTGYRKAAFSDRFACAPFCEIRLTVRNLPGSVVLLSDAVQRRRPVKVPAAKVAEGFNLATTSILSASAGQNRLIDLVADKNKAYSALLRFERRQLLDRVPEVELVESFKTQLVSRHQYHEGIRLIIDRTPRTFDFTLDVKVGP